MRELEQRTINPDSIKVEDLMVRFRVGVDEAVRMRHQYLSEKLFVNDIYQVLMSSLFGGGEFGWPDFIHLAITRLDLDEVRSWSDMQEIKNQLVGPEYEAVEIYPAESRKVDMGNTYHLWVLLGSRGYDPFTIPMGWNDRMVQES